MREIYEYITKNMFSNNTNTDTNIEDKKINDN